MLLIVAGRRRSGAGGGALEHAVSVTSTVAIRTQRQMTSGRMPGVWLCGSP